jgi:hypothetical protein
MMKLQRFLKDEGGTAPIEFLFVFPTIFMIFTASLESSLYMIRHIMLERSVDMVVRAIRLGLMDGVSHVGLKTAICNVSVMAPSVQSCVNRMKIWMQPIDSATFAMLAPPRSCVDTSQPISTEEPPANEFAYGSENQIMLMRICLSEKPMFPTTAVSIQMPLQPDGTYALVTTSVFVNEPES